MREPPRAYRDTYTYHTPRCPCHGYGGDPFAAQGGFSFNPMLRFNRKECVVARIQQAEEPAYPEGQARHAVPSPPPSPPPLMPLQPMAALQALEEGHPEMGPSSLLKLRNRAAASFARLPPGNEDEPARTLLWQPERWQRTCAVTLRVSAWMMHAMIDGMVLASAPSTSVLAATAVPITVCALQDVAAFTVAMARLGASSRRSLTAAVVALSCAFPIGALASHAVLERASSDTAVNVVRTVVAGVFTYIQTHARLCCVQPYAAMPIPM